MTNQPIKTITTPHGQHKIEIKEWITGRDREYIESAMMSGLNAKPHVSGKDSSVSIEKLDLEKLINETKHRAIEKFVVSVNDSKENILDAILDMHETDTDFVLTTIDELGKKKEK